MNQHQYKSYKTPLSQPRAIIYLDEAFRTQHFWHDWVVTRTLMEIEAKRYKREHQCSLRDARVRVWAEFTIADKERDETIYGIAKNCQKALRRIDIPVYFCHITIAKSILSGMNKTKAVKEFKEWLMADPMNGVIYEMKLNLDFTVSIIEDAPTPKKVKRRLKRRSTPKRGE